MTRSIDRRAMAGAKNEPGTNAKAKGERMSEYFSHERLHRSVTRGELFSLLSIIDREHVRLRHTPWWKRLWWRVTAARVGQPVGPGGEAPLTHAMNTTQEAAEDVSKGEVRE